MHRIFFFHVSNSAFIIVKPASCINWTHIKLAALNSKTSAVTLN